MNLAVGLPRAYARFALGFVLVGVVLVLGVGAYVFGAAEVSIVMRQPEVGASMVVAVAADPRPQELAVAGVVLELVVEGSRSGPTSGRRPASGDTVGSVTLTNRTGRSQVLVATTRLLAGDGTLLRLKDRVSVPAQGTTTAQVYPDQPEAFRELPATTFTIPGLAPSLQRDIFASTQQPLVAGGGEVLVVQTADLDALERELADELSQRGLLELSAQLSPPQTLHTKLVETEMVERSADAQPGDERTSVTVTLRVRVAMIAFDEAKMLSLVARQLGRTLPPGQRLASVPVDRLRYTVGAYDPAAGTATVTVNATGTVGLAADSPWLDPGALVGMTAAEIQRHYAPLGSAATVQVRLIPSWLAAAPRVANRIRIVVR